VGEYFEDRRVGASIRFHRESLGLLFSDLIDAAGPGSERMLRHTERAERPRIDLVEHHHAALMAAYANAGRTLGATLARREQWYATEADRILWHLAMDSRPQVAWWWGVRADPGPRGAWCYVCDRMIHGYDVGRGMTKRARKAVMAHRLEHINILTAEAAAETKESGT